jgi:hypothetical protein
MNLILSTENEAKLGNWFVISGRRQAAGGRRRVLPYSFQNIKKHVHALLTNFPKINQNDDIDPQLVHESN